MVFDNVTKCNVSGPMHKSVFNNFDVNIVENANKQYLYVSGKSNESYELISVSYL